MQDFTGLARLLMYVGLFLLIAGGILFLMGKFNLPFFRLPGDIYIKKDHFTFYFPLMSCILLSILISVIVNIFFRR